MNEKYRFKLSTYNGNSNTFIQYTKMTITASRNMQKLKFMSP